tara:strand:+ start:4028 stop:5077 length:1050 start_codon:yes stop_codon:yes gene_type:complete
MKKRNLSAKKKIHNFFVDKVKNPKIKKVFIKFRKNIERYVDKKICVAVSGGPDSMALAFLTKAYSIQYKKTFFYYTVDHKLRPESTEEANLTIKKLKEFDIDCEILTWKERKNSSNIQSQARDKRYELIFNQCSKKKIHLVLTAHQEDDLFENFFIRLIRGSGLKGLSSFYNTETKINKYKDILILRPLLNISKKDLYYITSKTFNFFIKDPSNINKIFLRIKIRKLLKKLVEEGLTLNKFKATLENLYKSSLAIEFYVSQNLKNNSKYFKIKNSVIINQKFFNQPDEIVFRSFSELIHKIGDKKNYTRGSKISSLIKNIKLSKNFKKMTLSGCILEKVNKSIIIYREI